MKKNNFNLSEFSSVSLAQWQGQLASDLEKVNRPSNLVKTTLDGIQLQALYSKENYESVNELKTNPGEYPYVRGFNSLVDTPVQMQYRVNIDDQDDFSLNIKKALAHGVKQLIFNFDLSSEKCISALDEEKIEILKELDPEIEIAFEFGEYYIPLIPKVLNRINHDSTFFRIDPISLLLKRGQLSFCIDKHVRFVKDIFHSSKKDDFKRFFNFSSMALARSGANHIQEVSYLVSNAIFWLRQFDKKDWGHLIGNMQFTLSTNNLFFHNIAKVRAFRLVWSRALKVLEVEEFANLIHISTAVPELILSQFDPMMNVLRNTVTNFSSQCAGVDYYLPMAYDSLLRSRYTGLEREKKWSTRLAQNTSHLLTKESHIDQVMDPAGGSWFVEELTKQMGLKSWSYFQKIEKDGGLYKFIKTNKLHEDIQEIAKERVKRLRMRTDIISGVNQFSNTEEQIFNVLKEKEHKQFSYEDEVEPAKYKKFVEHLREDKDIYIELYDLYAGHAKTGHIMNILKAHADGEKMKSLENLEYLELYENLRLKVEEYKETNELPKIQLICIGNESKLSARISFCRNYFELCEFEIIEHYFSTFEELAGKKEDNDFHNLLVCSITVFCSVNEIYNEILPENKLIDFKSKGKFIAGKIDEELLAGNELQAIFSGQDVINVLINLLTKLGVLHE